MTDKKSRINRATILLVVVVFSALWVLINSGQVLIAGIVFTAIPLISIVLYRQWDFIVRGGKLEGIGSNYLRDISIGVGSVLAIITLNNFLPGVVSIGIPPVQSIASDVGRFLIIVISAPIAEELLFRDILHDYFESGLKQSFFISAILASLLFSLFHLSVYGESLVSAQGSFLTAGLAGMIFSYLNKYTNSNTSNITAHMALNIWLGYFKLGIISF